MEEGRSGHEELTPRELGFEAAKAWAKNADRAAVKRVAETGLLPDRLEDVVLRAGIEAHLAQFEESEAAATEFTLGFTQGARAFLPRLPGS